MLILQRHPGQSIWIGENIQVTILGNTKGITRVGIKAPKEVNIIREELCVREPEYGQKSVITQTY